MKKGGCEDKKTDLIIRKGKTRQTVGLAGVREETMVPCKRRTQRGGTKVCLNARGARNLFAAGFKRNDQNLLGREGGEKKWKVPQKDLERWICHPGGRKQEPSSTASRREEGQASQEHREISQKKTVNGEKTIERKMRAVRGVPSSPKLTRRI